MAPAFRWALGVLLAAACLGARPAGAVQLAEGSRHAALAAQEATSWCSMLRSSTPERELALTMLLWVVALGNLAYAVVKLILVWMDFRRFRETRRTRDKSNLDHEKDSFRDYLSYKTSRWFSNASHPELWMLLTMFVMVLLIGVVMYQLAERKGVGHTIYQIMVWLVAPDGGVLETTRHGAALGLLTSLGGLFLFALLMTVMGAMFDNYLEGLRSGQAAVLEVDHILILGFTTDTIPLVKELCLAHEDCKEGGATIVILSQQPKPEVEKQLEKAQLLHKRHPRGSRVVVRTGCPNRRSDLKFVAADLCRVVIPMPARHVEKELRDAYMLQALATLRGNRWPRRKDGRVLISCSLSRNQGIFKDAGGDKAELINIDEFMSSVLVTSSRQKGLAPLISNIFSSEGNEFHCVQVPRSLVGKPFAEAGLYYPKGIIVGVITQNERQVSGDSLSIDDAMLKSQQSSQLRRPSQAQTPSKSRVTFDFRVESRKFSLTRSQSTMYITDADRIHICPNADYKLRLEDVLFVLAEDDRSIEEAAKEPMREVEETRNLRGADNRKRGCDGKEVFLFLGWNDLIGLSLLQIDAQAARRVKVISFAPESVEQREAEVETCLKRYQTDEFRHVEMEYYVGLPGSRFQLEEVGEDPDAEGDVISDEGIRRDHTGIKWAEVSRVFVFADQNCEDPSASDAITMTAAMQVIDILSAAREREGEEGPLETPVICEIRDLDSVDTCRSLGLNDLVVSSELPAQVLATMAMEPLLKDTLLKLMASGEYQIGIRQLQEYGPVKEDGEVVESLTGSFLDIAQLVSSVGGGDVLIGWRVNTMSTTALSEQGQMSSNLRALVDDSYDLNPVDKTEEHDLSAGASLVVVGKSVHERRSSFTGFSMMMGERSLRSSPAQSDRSVEEGSEQFGVAAKSAVVGGKSGTGSEQFAAPRP